MTAIIAVTLLGVVALASTGLAIQGFILAANNAPRVAEVVSPSTAIGQTPVSETVEGQIEVVPGFTRALDAIELTNADPVYTRDGAGAGAAVAEGSIVAVVAERPLIVLTGEIPAYRALGPGTVGRDVAQLQRALRTLGYSVRDADSHYGNSTAIAVYKFYVKAGFSPADVSSAPVPPQTPSTAGVPYGEVRFIPSMPAQVDSTCGLVGEQAEGAVCSLSGGTPTARIAVPVVEAGVVTLGMSVAINLVDGTTFNASVGSRIADPPEAEEPQTGGESVTLDSAPTTTASFSIEVPGDVSLALNATGSGIISITSSEDGDLSVEAIAIRSTQEGASWLELTDGSRLKVNVGLCASGFCVVSGEDVVEGVEVLLVSPRVEPAPDG